jgi:uncharacterized protein
MAKVLYLLGGLIAVGLGILGVFLPIMPTVPFLIVAAFCFARSNPVWEQRLLNHPHYGPILLDWRERGAVSRRVKVVAIGMISMGVGFTWFTIGWPWVAISITILLTFGPWLWLRPE